MSSPRAKLRIATRGSQLARTQSAWVARKISEAHAGHAGGVDCELVIVTTRGDTDTGVPLTAFPEQGIFTKAVQDAVRDGRADAAVHSLKDLPTGTPDGLVLGAIPERADPSDALVSRHPGGVAGLPDGADVGTGSPRRQAQLLDLRRDLLVTPVRGNIDTRIAKVANGDVDAVVLAAAGLTRLGRADEISEILGFVPAPGQGALGVECRADDARTIEILEAVDDETARVEATTERVWLATTGAGCHTTAAARAVKHDSEVELTWFYDGRRGSGRAHLDDAAALARAEGERALS